MEIQSISYPRQDAWHAEVLPFDGNGIVSLFDTHREAETAVIQLQHLGFNMKNLSIVGRDFQTEENIIGFYNLGDRTKYWGKQGAFWGAICGVLFGSALFVIPGFGPLVVAGTFISSLISAVEGAVVFGGFSVLGAALYGIGIPKNTVIQYEAEVRQGKYMMIMHGSMEELSRARTAIIQIGGKNTIGFDITEEDSDE